MVCSVDKVVAWNVVRSECGGRKNTSLLHVLAKAIGEATLLAFTAEVEWRCCSVFNNTNFIS